MLWLVYFLLKYFNPFITKKRESFSDWSLNLSFLTQNHKILILCVGKSRKCQKWTDIFFSLKLNNSICIFNLSMSTCSILRNTKLIHYDIFALEHWQLQWWAPAEFCWEYEEIQWCYPGVPADQAVCSCSDPCHQVQLCTVSGYSWEYHAPTDQQIYNW